MVEQSVVSETSKLNNDSHPPIDWQQLCRTMLEKSLPLDSVNTQPGETLPTSQNAPLFLKIFSTQQENFRLSGSHPQFKDHHSDEELRTYSPAELLYKLLELDLCSHQGKRLAIIGEGGTGKTLFLRQIAHLLMEGNPLESPQQELNHSDEFSVPSKPESPEMEAMSQGSLVDLLNFDEETEYFPIWVSPFQLKTLSLKDYLLGPWLQQAIQEKEPDLEIYRKSFEQLLNTGKVWILADGIDTLAIESESPIKVGSLSAFGRSLQDFTEPINLVLTCRTETWQLDPKGLSGFDRYQTKKLSYPTEVEATIKHWFATNQRSIGNNHHTHDSKEENPEDLGKELCELLAKPDQESVRPWLSNPLALVLCCRFWQGRPDFFPKNSAELYEQLVAQFYQWKAEQLPTSSQQQQELNQQLGELAKKILLKNQGYTQPIAHDEIQACWGEEATFLRLFLRLGWLIPRGLLLVQATSPSELPIMANKHYGFCDRIFRDYFAALAIADWQFFLDIPERNYRLFEPQWQNVLFFWFGRPDVHSSQKDAFIKALMTFEDNFSEHNFYGKRAYLLAVQLLTEFQECIYREILLNQLKDWAEGKENATATFKQSARAILSQTYRPFVVDLYLQELKRASTQADYQRVGTALLQFAKGNLIAIASIENQLTHFPHSPWRYTLAETLGLIDPGNQRAIATFIEILDDPQNSEDCQIALAALNKIAVGDDQAIAAVVEFLSSELSSTQQRQALNCLETIGQGHSLAIAYLLQRFRVYRGGSLRCQTAESLEKIDPGNPTAISVLLHLLQPSQTTEIRKQAIYSLGETSASYPQAITALIDLLQSDDDIFIRWLAISSLTKIGVGNPTVIKAFENLIEESQDNLQLKETGWLIKEVMEALAKIDPTNPVLLNFLVDLIQPDINSEGNQEIAESLGKLDPGNPTAIAMLGQLLKAKEDEFTQRQAAASLGKIDSGNLEALMMLIHLLQQSLNPDIRRLSAQSLGDITPHNAAAIAALIRTALITPDKETRRASIKSLGKIGLGNREVCQTLIDLLRVQSHQNLHSEIAENLIKILSRPLMPFVIHPLKESLLNTVYQPDPALYDIFWHCAQSLTYETFYQAWYQLPLDATPAPSQDSLAAMPQAHFVTAPSPSAAESAKDKLNLREDLFREIHNHSPLASLIQVIWIDCSQFLAPDEPIIDIYDQMLAQNCPEFGNGVPDNLAKLRLYWRLIQRNRLDCAYIWLFDHSSPNCSPFSSEFLEKFKTFQGNIALISDQPNNPLVNFSPHSPQLIATIIEWIKAQINKF
ncbi:MAG: HEAT repeat domain-containing protein [Snowella sp.]|nr:HEAT repeat domain-containing protein [Snowella sp.]